MGLCDFGCSHWFFPALCGRSLSYGCAGRFFGRVVFQYPGFEGRGSMGTVQESRERKGERCEWLKKADRHRKIEF